MFEKQVAIFFIFLANIILLAHAAVPHHQHETQVCIESSHCPNDSIPHNHNTSGHNNQHDGENGSDCCHIKQLVVVPSNHVKQEGKCSFLTDGHFPDYGFQAVLLNLEFQHFRSTVVLNTDVPFRTSHYIVFVKSSLGLRAPPTV
jgi:hypothetical protein